MPRESTIQANIIKRLRAMGAYVVNIAGGPYQSKGIPDLLVCYKGRFVGLEIKQPGRYPTVLQKASLAAIQSAGGLSAVVRSVEEAESVLRDSEVPILPREANPG